MNRQTFCTENAPKPIGPYSQAIIYNNLLFISGQGPIDPVSNTVHCHTVEEQSSQALNNLKTILEEAGFSIENVLKVNVYLDNINDFAAFNKIYEGIFASSKPARACIQAGKLPFGWKVEVEAIVGRDV